MANPGVGNKFVSVNLNKSYGQPNHHNHHNHGSFGSNRGRGGSGSGVGGGMVVLSRPRSSQKAGPKLSVPPPLNLPSLRKEHEKFDSLGSIGGPAGVGISGGGVRPSSSGMGWTRPGTVALQEKEGFSGDQVGDGSELGLGDADRVVKVSSSVYLPPSARSTAVGSSAPVSVAAFPPSEKTPVLRGEDFPSLQAALPSVTAVSQKQKDGFQKQKQVVGDESFKEQRNGNHSSGRVDMRPQLQSSRDGICNEMRENDGKISVDGSRATEQIRKLEEYFPGPLPIVRMNPRSDWADDERDTSSGLIDRVRDHGFPKRETYWERDFDMPRIGVLPHKPIQNASERWGQRDNEAGKVASSEVPKRDPHSRDGRTPSREGREGNLWKGSTLPKDGPGVAEVGSRPSGMNREILKENKYTSSPFRENGRDDFGRKEGGYGQGGKQSWYNTTNSYGSRGSDWNMHDRHGNEHNRYRDGALQNNSMFKSSYSSSSRGINANDPILLFGKDKRHFAKSEKPYVEDPFVKDFEATDPFSGGPLGVLKRKKDVLKQTDFHDPVRESFEAELERVQKMQEQERRRAVEEQERAQELARREEEERIRFIREQEDRRRKLEEEAREAAWRAEQELLEATRRAEEQRIAREEEKRRIFLEEERRKEAAKQKLLELEERIAKRQCEPKSPGLNASAPKDDQLSLAVKEKDMSRAAEVSDWEEGERMVERITTSASSDSGNLNRPSEMGSRSQSSRDSAAFLERGKSFNSWRRDTYDNGNSSILQYQDQDSGHHSPRRDGSVGGRSYTRKEFYGGPGSVPSRTYHKGVSDSFVDDFPHIKGQRWNVSGDGDHYSRNQEIVSETNEQLVEKFGDLGWGQGRFRGNSYSQYSERPYPNPEADGPYSYGRSRYSVRQPRVLPPPSISSVHKSSYRSEVAPSGPSTYLDTEIQYNHAARNEANTRTTFDDTHHGQPEIVNVQQENEQKRNGKITPRCDSQSSLSVSSPPSSPTHLSHEDLDESGESAVLSGVGCKDVSVSGQENEVVGLPSNADKENMITDAGCVSAGEDDEWTVENNEQLQEQEEYDEDEDGYEEEDEVHEGDDELHREFDDMHLEEKESSDTMDNLVLGFNEGVEVGMPNDDNNGSSFVAPQGSSNTVDGICGDSETVQPLNGGSQVTIDSPSRIFQESENGMQDLATQQSNAAHPTGESKLLDLVDPSSTGMLSQHPVISPLNLAHHTSDPAVANPAEAPIKLQFGLFSGPSLIPSPVPAIQIGSIQMPLHLHPQAGTSLSHMHPPQPLFQFGQLRYTTALSQGMMQLPLPPQSMPYVQHNVPSSFPFNQIPVGPLPTQPSPDSHQTLSNDNVSLLSADNKVGNVSRQLDASKGNTKIGDLFHTPEKAETPVIERGRSEISYINDDIRSKSGVQAAAENPTVVKNYTGLSTMGVQPSAGAALSQEKNLSGPKVQSSSGRGKRFIFAVKNSGSRQYPVPEADRPESIRYQRRSRRNIPRTEFRVRESADKRQSAGSVSPGDLGLDEKPNVSGKATGVSARTGPRRVILSHKATKQTSQSEILSSVPVSSREIDSAIKGEKGSGKDSSTKDHSFPQSGDGKHKRNICEGDVDAPLQSGVVRVFEQPGIEAPSDEDDFIEVRSKRQMLNDRREQREKEIKAKSRVLKVPRKSRSTSKITSSANSGNVSASFVGEAANIRPDFVAPGGHGLAAVELSTGKNTTALSQPLAPIGTPAVKNDSQTTRSVQTSSNPVVSGVVQNLGSGSTFDNKTKVLDNVQPSLSSWGNSRINQQVMALTQTQLEEAMKPGQFDSRASSANHNDLVNDSNMPSSSVLTKDKSFSSAASPVNSLLAGEKIQFGAVTSPTLLPPSSRVVSHGIGLPGRSRSDVQLSHSLSGVDNDCNLLFDKEKHITKSCVNLEDCEAEAAASAVAVAAISNDEIVGNGMGTCSVSVSDTQTFGGTGGSNDQQFSCQSRAEDSLTVSLPADLSVETPPISLWPPLPSPPNTSSQVLSHFPGGPPSHFPFYEMNPMLGSHVFAFGPHDESASATQSQSQKSPVQASAPLGAWQQCHSGVDSFYGPPAGFTGPFISPPGGIPGVQGPPHMVVYNHFAPVGQFGQVGLSFMGTTYIPSGKQPDWKHGPASSTMAAGEGEMNNLNMVPGNRNPATMPAPGQHLAPGSPLLPMASPMAMFDVSPFQSSADMSVQARWPHQSVSLSMPSQQQTDVIPSKLSHTPVDQSLAPNRGPESRNSTTSDKYPATNAQLPDELGLVDPSSSTINGSAMSMNSETIKTDVAQIGGNNVNVKTSTSNIMTQPSQHKANVSSQQHGPSSGYGYHRGGSASHRNNSVGEWNQRRMGFQGRNQSLGGEKGYHSSKMKQIYVAKQPTSVGLPSTSS